MAVERRFDFQPTLTGTLLELRPVTANDWIPLRALGSDPLVWAGDLPPAGPSIIVRAQGVGN